MIVFYFYFFISMFPPGLQCQSLPSRHQNHCISLIKYFYFHFSLCSSDKNNPMKGLQPRLLEPINFLYDWWRWSSGRLLWKLALLQEPLSDFFVFLPSISLHMHICLDSSITYLTQSLEITPGTYSVRKLILNTCAHWLYTHSFHYFRFKCGHTLFPWF